MRTESGFISFNEVTVVTTSRFTDGLGMRLR